GGEARAPLRGDPGRRCVGGGSGEPVRVPRQAPRRADQLSEGSDRIVNARFTREKVFARALLVANLLFFAVAILLMYDSQLAEANAYAGYLPVGIEADHIALLVVSVVTAAMLMP